MKKIILTIFLLTSLTGCYNYRELNEMAVVTGVAIDKEDNEYKTQIQVINPNKGSNMQKTDQADFITFTTKEKTIQDALRKTVTKTSRRVYANHIQILIISEDIAKDNLRNVLDFFIRTPEARMDFYVVIANKDKATDILNVLTPLTNASAVDINKNLESVNKYTGSVSLVTFNDLINMYLNPNLEIILPTIKIIGNNKNSDNTKNLNETSNYSNIKIDKMSIFKNNKLTNYLTYDESIALNFIKNEINDTLIRYKCNKDNYLVAQIKNSNTKINYKNKEIYIKIKSDGKLSEVNCDIDLTNNKEIDKINKNLEHTIKKKINKLINKAKNEYKTDFLGFKDLIYKTDYKHYNKIKNNWDNYFQNIKVNIDVDVNMYEKGNLLGGLYE